ncbi:MAG: PAS domain S-box protein [Methanomicrobiales archaeon]
MSKVKILLIEDPKRSKIRLKLKELNYSEFESININDPHFERVNLLNTDLILIDNIYENDNIKIEDLYSFINDNNIPILLISPHLSGNSLKKFESFDNNYYFFKDIDHETLKFAIESIESKSKIKKSSRVRLNELNKALSRMGSDPDENIQNLTIICGKLLNGFCALYRSMEANTLYKKAHWNLPKTDNLDEDSKKYICYDVVKSDSDDIFLINNLPDTDYYDIDPNVKAFNLKTYLGYPVKFAGKNRGSLCVLYENNYIPDEDEKELLKIIASAIGEEEERKNIISNLNESEELFQSLWENSLDATLILNWDGEILFANPAAAKIGGLSSPAEAIGKNILNYVDEKTQNKIKKHINLVKNDQGGFLAEYEVKSPNNDKLWVEGLGTKIQYKGKAANIVTVRDITPRKIADEKIKESEAFYKSIFENTGNATILVEENSLISLANTEFENLSGYSRKEIQGKMKWTEFVYPDYKEKMLKYHGMRRVNPEKAPNKYEFKFIDKNQNVKDIFLKVDIIKDSNISVASLMDITDRKAAAKELKESNELYKTLIQTSPEAITVTDLEGKINYVSQRKLEIYGYEKLKELIGKNALELVKLEYQEKAEKDLKKIAQEGIIRNHEYEMIKKNGKFFTAEISASLFKDVNNHPKGIIITTRDITQRKKIQEKLKKREELLSIVTDNMLNVVGQVDSTGIFHYISPSVKNILGYEVDEVLGSSVFDFLEKVHPNDYEEVKNTFIKSTISYMPGDVKHRYKHANGNYLWLESLGNPLFDNENNFRGVIFSLTDITDLKKAEIDLRNSKEKYRTLFASSPDYIIVIDLDGQILAINDILRHKLSKYVDNVSHVENVKELGKLSVENEIIFEKIRSLIISGESVKPFETEIEGLDDKEYWLEIRTIPLKQDDIIKAVTVIVRDISERKLYEYQIEKSLAEKDLLLKEIHHRVKNNLQIISSLLNLQSTFIDDSAAYEVFRESQNRVKSMAMIHEQLYQSKDLSHINFSDYIKSLVSGLLSSYTINPEQIKINIDVRDISMDINTAVPCGLIINELITNSLKHAFPDPFEGSIDIKMDKKEDEYVLEISDNGIGIPKEIDIKTNKTLGFLLINSLVKQLEGNIHIDRGKGTRFTVNFSEIKYEKRI